MTKEEFIRSAAKHQKNSVLETRYWVDTILAELKRAIIEEERLDLYGFGKFEHIQNRGRMMKNSYGEEVYSKPWTKIKFTPSQYMKGAVKDHLTMEQLDERMKMIRAFNRGEDVPGIRCITNGRPVMVDDGKENGEEDSSQ